MSVAGVAKVLTPSQLATFDFLQSVIGNIIFTPANLAVERAAEWTNLSPRFVVDYHWTPDVMTYASASYGYKAGGFDSVSINSQFQPEKVANYETGIKSQWFNHKVEANLSGYYYEYTNQQSITLVSTAGSLVPQYQTQTGDSNGKGVDAEFVWKPLPDLSIHLTEGFLDANWSKRVAPRHDPVAGRHGAGIQSLGPADRRAGIPHRDRRGLPLRHGQLGAGCASTPITN
ncbi:MAG: TonB-dependent receptor [Aliidongia sp.]